MDTNKEQNSTETETTAQQNSSKEEMEQNAKSTKNSKILMIIAVSVLAVALVIGGVMLAKSIHSKESTSVSDSSEAVKKAHGDKAEVVTGEEATAKAEVTGSDAIETIQSYSDEQLGLKKDDYSFMVAQQAYTIKGDSYVQVIAAVKKENKDGTFSITPAGKYYISFDGKTVLKEDMKNPGNYEKIK